MCLPPQLQPRMLAHGRTSGGHFLSPTMRGLKLHSTRSAWIHARLACILALQSPLVNTTFPIRFFPLTNTNSTSSRSTRVIMAMPRLQATFPVALCSRNSGYAGISLVTTSSQQLLRSSKYERTNTTLLQASPFIEHGHQVRTIARRG